MWNGKERREGGREGWIWEGVKECKHGVSGCRTE